MVTKPLLLALVLASAAPARAEPPPAPREESAAAGSSLPALPFRYVGRMVHAGRIEVLLMRGEALHPAQAGTRIGEYRLDEITPSTLRFTYLPLNRRQEMALPGVF